MNVVGHRDHGGKRFLVQEFAVPLSALGRFEKLALSDAFLEMLLAPKKKAPAPPPKEEKKDEKKEEEKKAEEVKPEEEHYCDMLCCKFKRPPMKHYLKKFKLPDSIDAYTGELYTS